MRKLDETIATLKLMLATIRVKESDLQNIERQASEQQRRIINFLLYQGGELERGLRMMDDVGQRGHEASRLLTQLSAVKARAEDDLRAMELTKQIEDAKDRLTQLRQRRSSGEDVDRDIVILESEIVEASEAAGRLIRPDAF